MGDALGLTTALNTLAVTIACHLEGEELALLGASLVQLGDTLTTIAAQRALCEKCYSTEKAPLEARGAVTEGD